MVNPVEWWDAHWIEDRILRKLKTTSRSGHGSISDSRLADSRLTDANRADSCLAVSVIFR